MRSASSRRDYMALAGESNLLDITIMQHSERMSLLYRVKDAAGNEMQTVRFFICDYCIP